MIFKVCVIISFELFVIVYYTAIKVSLNVAHQLFNIAYYLTSNNRHLKKIFILILLIYL